MPHIEISHRWRYWDDIRKRFVTTKYWTTEQRIKAEYPDAEPVPQTERRLEIADNPLRSTSMAHFNTGFPK